MPDKLTTTLNRVPEHSIITAEFRLSVDLCDGDGLDVEQVGRLGHALEGDQGARPVQPHAEQGSDRSRFLRVIPGSGLIQSCVHLLMLSLQGEIISRKPYNLQRKMKEQGTQLFIYMFAMFCYVLVFDVRARLSIK